MIYEIAFWTLIIVAGLWLIWEMVPDPAKKYWNYIRMTRKDRKLGIKRKYIFSFRNGIGQ